MLRILWRDNAQLASVEEACNELSQLADCCIRAAVRIAETALEDKYGTPVGDESGQPQSLVVLGMGKLGGNELNFSSDVDLIFAYPESGATQGGRQQLDNQSYFTRLGQMVIRLLDAVTEEAFVFRVDMRLRPYGDSGALVGAYSALEVYYQEQGREWERYAMIKARPLTGSQEARESLMAMLGSFVYRRYTDFSVIAALRDMKRMMRAEVARLGIDDDLKRGAGGIREIEFIAQSLQLIHGGRIPEIRCRSLLETLQALTKADLLSSRESDCLTAHYRLERRVEHALQAMQDKQTQSLPQASLPRAQLALLSGFADWQTLDTQLSEARREVDALFNDLIAEPTTAATTDETDAPFGLSFAALNEEALAEMGVSAGQTKLVSVGGISRKRLGGGVTARGAPAAGGFFAPVVQNGSGRVGSRSGTDKQSALRAGGLSPQCLFGPVTGKPAGAGAFGLFGCRECLGRRTPRGTPRAGR